MTEIIEISSPSNKKAYAKKPLREGKYFCFTQNNPSVPPSFPPDSKYVYQLEKGASGTPHYQGYIEFGSNMKPARLKKEYPGFNWDNRNGNQKQAYDYCTKEDTRVEPPVFNFTPVDSKQGKRSDLDGMRTLILGKRSLADLYQDPELDDVMAKFPKWVTGKEPLLYHAL